MESKNEIDILMKNTLEININSKKIRGRKNN